LEGINSAIGTADVEENFHSKDKRINRMGTNFTNKAYSSY
jgi:hypothetical protein